MNLLNNLTSNFVEKNLDIESVEKIGNSPQIMIYGFAHCFYNDATIGLRHSPGKIQKVFNYMVGSNSEIFIFKTLEGRPIEKIPTLGFFGQCKNGITNLVLENYKRAIEGKPLIPILFFVDCDNNAFPLNERSFTSKKPKANQVITHKELRRVYKLCIELENHPAAEMRELAQIAKATFKFVKISKIQNKAVVTEIAAFWQNEKLASAWQKRKEFGQFQDQLKNLETEINKLKNKIPLKAEEVEKIALTPAASVKEKVKVMNELHALRDCTEKLQKQADALFESEIKPVILERYRATKADKQKKYDWRENLLTSIKKFHQGMNSSTKLL